eukprot:COSAG02_NODE_140_length_34374_cov_913.416443_15_plen_62_part_00
MPNNLFMLRSRLYSGWSGTEVQEALSQADSVLAVPGTTPGINYEQPTPRHDINVTTRPFVT